MFRFGERMKDGKCKITTCLLYDFLICFVKELGERGENFLIRQREKFCQHIQSFHLRAVFYGLLQGFLPSLVLQGLWIPKESFGEAFV